jgi:protocatechuate 3,4-dioxygenase beta subunit
MRTALLSLLAISNALAQTGKIAGVVVDSASHQPVKKASVSIIFLGDAAGIASGPSQKEGPHNLITDASGAFAFSDLSPGQYQLIVTHQNYPQARMGGVHKIVQLTAVDSAETVTMELIPGAAITGHVVDEDGDPLTGCNIQPHSAKDFNQGIAMMHNSVARDDGSYRISGIPPGKYTITAQCMTPVFQPRPLSEGPDPPPSAAYPMLFYPAASDIKSAQIVELLPGTEKSGIDFQIRPAPVTHIHGTLVAGSADWRGRDDLQVQLAPLDPRGPRSFVFTGGTRIDPKDGTFEFRQVFPGSYRVMVFSQDFSARPGPPDAGNRVGAVARVDVADKPIELSLQLHRAVDISGTVEIERSNSAAEPLTPSQINIQLTAESQFGPGPTPTQVNDDGTFTIKSVLPGEWRLRLNAPGAFAKSVRLGADDVTDKPLELTSGSAAPLHIVVSNNTASIRGTASAGQMIFAARIVDEEDALGWQQGTQVDSNGQFVLPGLAPGKYRIVAGELGSPMPEEGGQEVTVAEGETATVDIKPDAIKPDAKP